MTALDARAHVDLYYDYWREVFRDICKGSKLAKLRTKPFKYNILGKKKL